MSLQSSCGPRPLGRVRSDEIVPAMSCARRRPGSWLTLAVGARSKSWTVSSHGRAQNPNDLPYDYTLKNNYCQIKLALIGIWGTCRPDSGIYGVSETATHLELRVMSLLRTGVY